MYQYTPTSLSQIFVPSISIKSITVRHTLGRLLVAPHGSPTNVCGIARRIGYTGKRDHDLAIYRLKIKTLTHKAFVTLPMLFVVEGGIFVEYEQWKKNNQENTEEINDD